MKIGLISITRSAMPPILAALAKYPDLQATAYLDEGLQQLVQREQGVTAHSMARMEQLICQSEKDGAEAVLITCTVFTPHIQALRERTEVPIISADGAMLQQAARLRKKTAILCTFPASMETSASIFAAEADQIGWTAHRASVFLLEDAADALRLGDKEAHDELIASKAMQLGQEYEVVVLAQISMADAGSLLTNASFQTLTSPQSAVDALFRLRSNPLP